MKASNLTPQHFLEWRRSLGISQQAAARMLGISMSSICLYEVGKREDREVKIPLLVALGMSALKAGLTYYEGESENVNSF